MCTVLGHGHSHGGGHGHAQGGDKRGGHFCQERTHDKVEHDTRNINVRAAFIHTIGDLIQSLGVLLAAYLIKFRVSLGGLHVCRVLVVVCLMPQYVSIVGVHSCINKTFSVLFVNELMFISDWFEYPTWSLCASVCLPCCSQPGIWRIPYAPFSSRSSS